MRPSPNPPNTPYSNINIGTFTEKVERLKATQVMMLPGSTR